MSISSLCDCGQPKTAGAEACGQCQELGLVGALVPDHRDESKEEPANSVERSERRIRDMYEYSAAGMSLDDIASIYGVNRSVIRQHILRHIHLNPELRQRNDDYH